MSGTFALLRHAVGGAVHWDLLLPAGARLATWQCGEDPCSLGPGESLPCRKLPDHRRAYLDYEGTVSGDRGEVRRVERGRCRVLDQSPETWRVELRGTAMQGDYELQRLTGQEWQLCRQGQSPDG